MAPVQMLSSSRCEPNKAPDRDVGWEDGVRGRVWGVWSGAFRVDAASSRLLIRARQAKDKWINGALLGSSPLNINSHLDSSTVWFPFTACGLIGWQAGTRVFWGSDNRRTLCCEHGARHELSFQLCAGHRGTIPSLAVCNLENTSLIFFFFFFNARYTIKIKF